MADKFKGPLTTPTKSGKVGKFKGPTSVVPKEEPAPSSNPLADFGSGAMQFTEELLRNFNDTLTFGLWDKGLEATGIQPNASQRTAESNPVAQVIGKTAGGIPGGLGFEKLASELIPQLAKSTIPAIMGRNALSSGAMSATDDVIRDGTIDPIGVGLDAGLGGILSGGLAIGSRAISPKARVRAKGNDLTLGDKQAATGFAKSARDNGIMLDSVEALNKVAPSRTADVVALQDDAINSPAGSQSQRTFEAGRTPGIQAAGREVVDNIGGTTNPFEIQMAAKDAIDSVAGGFNASANVGIDKLGQKKVAPSWVPKGDAAYGKAAKKVLDDPVVMQELNNPAENQISFLSEVLDKLDKAAAKADSAVGSAGFQKTRDKILSKIDQISRGEYSASRSIAEQGGVVVDELRSGPLGKIAGAANTKTQGASLFGVQTAADADAAKEAVRHLPGDTSRGILSNTLDAAASRNPTGFAREALPNDNAMSVADDVTRGIPGAEDTGQVLDQLRAVDSRIPAVTMMDPRSGPTSTIWSKIRDIGKGGVADLLQDPDIIEMMGKTGPLQTIIAQTLLSMSREVTDNKRNGSDDKRYVEITVGP